MWITFRVRVKGFQARLKSLGKSSGRLLPKLLASKTRVRVKVLKWATREFGYLGIPYIRNTNTRTRRAIT